MHEDLTFPSTAVVGSRRLFELARAAGPDGQAREPRRGARSISRTRQTVRRKPLCAHLEAASSRSNPAPQLPDPHRPLELIHRLQHLLPEIFRQRRMIGKVLLHHRQCLLVAVPANERAEPAAEEEDPAVGLDVRQRVERAAPATKARRRPSGVVSRAACAAKCVPVCRCVRARAKRRPPRIALGRRSLATPLGLPAARGVHSG